VNGVEVVAEHVRKSFEGGRIVALADVSLRLEPGEFVALTGPSGCGKSTLLNILGALDRADAGELRVGRERLDRLDNPSAYRSSTVGFVFQFHYLIPTLSALENVEVPLVGRARRRERERRARELLREVGLSERERSRPTTLSGGERQRVAIARALANEPQLLLADEPTGALDADTGAQILALLRRVREERGTTILMVTNDEATAEVADRVLRMRDGVVVTRDEAPRPARA
jgi:putative ABC transport system ATP-binding protein